MALSATSDAAGATGARPWRFGIRAKMWATFAAVAVLVLGATLVSWSSYRETDRAIGRIVDRTLPLMAKLSDLARMSQKMLAITPAALMADDVAAIERAAATFAHAQVQFAEALARLDDETALRSELGEIRAAAMRIDADISLLLAAQRQRIRLAASFAAASDQVDVLHQEYRLMSDSSVGARPKARQFLLLANRMLVGLAEVGRIDTLEDVEALSARLRPALAQMRRLLDHPDVEPLGQGATRIVARIDALTFGETALTTLREREITTRAVAGLRLSALAEASRVLDDDVSRLMARTARRTAAERDETAAMLDRSQSLLLALGSGCALGSLALAFLYLGRGILDRLARLGATMRRIAAGDLASPIDTRGGDELGDMARDLAVFRDAIAKVNHVASHDMLTGLGNRAMLETHVTRHVARGGRGALLYFGLDGFRDVVETFGFDTGDAVLRLLAERLKAAVRPGDVAARVGADRFVVAAPDLADEADIQAFAARIAAVLRKPLRFDDLDLEVDPFAGVARYPDDGAQTELLLHRADLALRAGTDNRTRREAALYAEEIGERAARRRDIRTDLKLAIERGDFVLHYQPKMRIRTGRIEGVEALVRWNHPHKGPISPADFIPLAESSGLILPLGRWVLREACRQAQAWVAAGHPPLRVAVNISPVQFLRDDMVEAARAALADSGLDAELLELEITEGVLLHQEGNVAARMRALREMGVRLAIDDFGTGYSSLSYLKTLPVDTLKIDQAFVRPATPGNDDARICTAIIGLAHDLGLEVVAEGIEWQSHIDFLQSEGCDVGQGYFISRPLAPEAIPPFLETWKSERLALREVAS
ncbi:Diguanylate cyclase [uncultured Alphaproteobacteria bacterium]|uniref:Diguanylate cyclase n=1 Tax=uncultured Alphaproteobacteria bacterium TaxID=91750 RepID=A0A212KMV0_9PROT|nr:Diguanylate cyclase [uncultured Alphaproteobacteria bacterium]